VEARRRGGHAGGPVSRRRRVRAGHGVPGHPPQRPRSRPHALKGRRRRGALPLPQVHDIAKAAGGLGTRLLARLHQAHRSRHYRRRTVFLTCGGSGNSNLCHQAAGGS
jgi:hypothetical protein